MITGHLSPATGAIKDRVVAFVDDNAITLSELEVMYSVTKKITPDTSKEDVLNTMVNRLLLLREAKKSIWKPLPRMSWSRSILTSR